MGEISLKPSLRNAVNGSGSSHMGTKKSVNEISRESIDFVIFAESHVSSAAKWRFHFRPAEHTVEAAGDEKELYLSIASRVLPGIRSVVALTRSHKSLS